MLLRHEKTLDRDPPKCSPGPPGVPSTSTPPGTSELTGSVPVDEDKEVQEADDTVQATPIVPQDPTSRSSARLATKRDPTDWLPEPSAPDLSVPAPEQQTGSPIQISSDSEADTSLAPKRQTELSDRLNWAPSDKPLRRKSFCGGQNGTKSRTRKPLDSTVHKRVRGPLNTLAVKRNERVERLVLTTAFRTPAADLFWGLIRRTMDQISENSRAWSWSM